MSLPSQSPPLSGVLFTLAAAIGFALSLVMARLSYEYGTNPQSVMLVRFVAMLVVLVLWARYKGLSLRLQAADLRGCLLCGFLYFSGIFAYLSSVAWLPVSLSVLIFYTFPILVALISAVMFRRMPSALTFFALGVAFGGLLLALDIRGVTVSTVGLAFAIYAAVAVAFNLVLSAIILQRVPTAIFTTYTAAVSALLAIIVVVFSGGVQLPTGTVGWIAFLAMLLSFFIGFISTFIAVGRLGSLRFSSIMNLEPIATIVFALLLLGETLSLMQMVGAMVVIAGVVLAQVSARQKTT